MIPELHFPENPLALHLLLQGAQGLIDVVVSNDDLNQLSFLRLAAPLRSRAVLRAKQAIFHVAQAGLFNTGPKGVSTWKLGHSVPVRGLTGFT